MACAQVPLQTLFETVVSTEGSVTTSTSIEVITEPAATQTSFTTQCLDLVNGTCVASTVESTVTTIPGQVITTTVIQPITADTFITTFIPTQTIFTSSCSQALPTTPTRPTTTTSNPPQTTPQITPQITPHTQSTPPADTSTTSNGNDDQETTSWSQSLGTPTVFTSVVVVTDNGKTTTSGAIVTQTPSMNVPIVSGSGTSNVHTGLIVGGVVGGMLGLALLGATLWIWWRRRNTRWDDIFDDDNVRADNPPRRDMLEAEVEPKPYEYGMIGATPPPPGHESSHIHHSGHGRSSSGTPLLHQKGQDPSARKSTDFSPTTAGTPSSGYPPSSYHHATGMPIGILEGGSRRSSLVAGDRPLTMTSTFSRESSAASVPNSMTPLVTRHMKGQSMGGAPMAWVTAEGGSVLPSSYGRVSPPAQHSPPADGPSSFVVTRQTRPIAAQQPSASSMFSGGPSDASTSIATSSTGLQRAPSWSNQPPPYSPSDDSTPGEENTGRTTSPVSAPSIYSRGSVDEMASLDSGMRLALTNPDKRKPGESPTTSRANTRKS